MKSIIVLIFLDSPDFGLLVSAADEWPGDVYAVENCHCILWLLDSPVTVEWCARMERDCEQLGAAWHYVRKD